MANALFRAGRHIKTHRQQVLKPAILQLSIEGLTASKLSVLYHLAALRKALVILLQETLWVLVYLDINFNLVILKHLKG